MTTCTPYCAAFSCAALHVQVGDGPNPDHLRPRRALQIGMADVAAADDANVDAFHGAVKLPCG